MSSDTPLQLTISFPDQATAQAVARQLVEARLVACAQLFPIQSIYRWEGIQVDEEVLLQAKTVAGRMGAIESLIKQRHPYEVPEMIALPIVWGHQPYLDWMQTESSEKT